MQVTPVELVVTLVILLQAVHLPRGVQVTVPAQVAKSPVTAALVAHADGITKPAFVALHIPIVVKVPTVTIFVVDVSPVHQPRKVKTTLAANTANNKYNRERLSEKTNFSIITSIYEISRLIRTTC
jgi:hypothetical protein